MSNSLDPDHDRHTVGFDLGTKCWLRISNRLQKLQQARKELKSHQKYSADDIFKFCHCPRDPFFGQCGAFWIKQILDCLKY